MQSIRMQSEVPPLNVKTEHKKFVLMKTLKYLLLITVSLLFYMKSEPKEKQKNSHCA